MGRWEATEAIWKQAALAETAVHLIVIVDPTAARAIQRGRMIARPALHAIGAARVISIRSATKRAGNAIARTTAAMARASVMATASAMASRIAFAHAAVVAIA